MIRTRFACDRFVSSALFLLGIALSPACAVPDDPTDSVADAVREGEEGGISGDAPSDGGAMAPRPARLECCAGYHVEMRCDPPRCDDEPPICFEECVEDPVCPRDTIPREECSQMGCWTTCVPTDVCPPGSVAETFCEGDRCVTQCSPTDVCPPGSRAQTTCDSDRCWTECSPVDACPPDLFAHEICDDTRCWIECRPR